MLHLHHNVEAPVAQEVLDAMFAARKSVFVDLLRWKVPVVEERYEIDQFDTMEALYLVLTDRTGDHLGSVRLLPTTHPHILDSRYAGLCDGSPPKGPGIFEITRFCLDRRLRAPERRVVRDTLILALVDHAHASGIERYTASAELPWFRQILAFGWQCVALGAPQMHDGRMLAALEICITHATARQLAEAGIAAHPRLHCRDPRGAA